MDDQTTSSSTELSVVRSADANIGGAPAGNKNHLRHGLYTAKMPPQCGHIKRQVNAYRAALEQAVEAHYGSVDVVAASRIQSACNAVAHACKASFWLSTHWDELDWPQRLAFSRETTAGLAQRDKAVAALGIESKARPTFDMPPIPTFSR